MRKTILWLIGLIAICCFAEIFLFNFRHWNTISLHGTPVLQYETGSGIQDNGNGTYTVTEGDCYFEIKNIDRMLRSSYIDIQVLGREESDLEAVVLWQAVMDESHIEYYSMPEREIVPYVERSKYMNYHLYGKCRNLKIMPAVGVGQTISVKVLINPRIPLFISWKRMLGLFLGMAVIVLFKPGSVFHTIPYLQLRPLVRVGILAGIFLLNGLLFLYLTRVNPNFRTEPAENHLQYQRLAEALQAGSASLLDKVPESLKQMENPYDIYARDISMRESGDWYQWDYAYYEGKYYVYFGVVPAVLFYLPYHLVTGEHIHNSVVVFIASILFLIGVLGTIHQFVKKWFPATSVAVWFLSVELLLIGSNIVYITKRPDLYTVPIVLGLGLGMLGLWCLLMAERDGRICNPLLGAGSLLIALVAGCRPQLFLFAVFGLILFGKYLFSKEFWKKEMGGMKSVCWVVIPMLAVAIPLMYYNYIRFGSPFDFGANYNLTFNDMRRRGWVWDRIPAGIVYYLFFPIRLLLRFPFIEPVPYTTEYMGITIQESMYGGLFVTNLFAWFGLLPILFRKRIGKAIEAQQKGRLKVPWACAVCSLLIGVLILIVDTEMSGLLTRYFGDINIFFMLASVLAVLLSLTLIREPDSALKSMILYGMLAAFFLCVAYQGTVFFLDTAQSLSESRKDLFYEAKYLVAFWL